MWVVWLCLLLVGCGPVHLGEELRPQGGGGNGEAGSTFDPSAGRDAASDPGSSGQPDAGLPPAVVVRITALDCGKCFELQAEGTGGSPPYDFEWEDGSLLPQRRVCVDETGIALSVVAVDSQRVRSASQTIRLQGGADADCAPPVTATDGGPAPTLCLENLSFEGTPVFNMGQAMGFVADPWSDCTNPLRDNTPDIGNEMIAVTPGVPPPMDGLTYLALAESEQVSQALCAAPPPGPLSFEIDLARVDLGGGVVPDTERVFLEIWGGLNVDCSLRELLWASPELQLGWQRFCVTLRPQSFMTQLTLLAKADMTVPSPAWLLVDNMKPVDSCP